MREPFGNTAETRPLPSPRVRTPNFRSIPFAFRTNSLLCRSDGLATSTKLSLRVYARWTAFAAPIVDFPHCRVQFRIPRLASDRTTAICASSASNPNLVRIHSPVSGGGAAAFVRA
jgi:hypothetical protein